MEGKNWIKLTAHGKSRDLEVLSAVMSLLDEGLLIEDYSDLALDTRLGELPPDGMDAMDREAAAVSVFLPGDTPVEDAAALVRERLGAAGVFATLSAEGVGEEDWAENWKQYYHPISFGRLTVVPAWEDYTAREGELILRMDPGTAFGTATHESTKMMLDFLTEELRGGERVLDVGCGSGILALAARLLGAESAAAYDLDPEAVRVAEKNIRDSGLSSVTAGVSDLLSAVRGAPFDFVLANIVSDILLRLAPDVPAVMKRGGLLAVSGVLEGRADEVKAGFAAAGLTFLREKREGDWCAMLFGRD